MKKLILSLILGLLLTLPTITGTALANNEFKPTIIEKPETLPGPGADEQTKSGGARNILVNTILPRFAISLIGFVGAVSLVFVIVGGVRFTISYGNEEDIENAKKQVIYGIAGFIIALLSYTIVRIITNLEFIGDENNNSTEITENA